jgi:NADPH:quinone reductase-like Zn-dependent oxidoreductase
MRAVVITAHGDPSVLRVLERPAPSCGPGQIRVAVQAAGVNFADVMARQGLYEDAPPLPSIVGYEVAGEVAEVGADVERWRVGDRVAAGCRFGGYSEEVVVAPGDCVALPDEMTFAQGAAIPVNYATAWAGLVGYGSLRAGERVLVHAAAGGVGTAAVQIAKAAGAEVWGTASPAKHAAVRANGADHAVDYTQDGWERDLGGFDVIMDALGGASFARSYKLLRAGGRLVAFGASSVIAGERKNLLTAAPKALRMIRGFSVLGQMNDSKAVIGLNLLRLWDDRGSLEPWITPLSALLDEGVVRPVVAAEVPFAQAGEAHRMLTERRNVGKVVLAPG